MTPSGIVALLSASLGRACLQGTLFILVAWILCRVIPRLPDTARCGLWWLASLKLLLGLAWATPVLLPLLPAASPHTLPSASNAAGKSPLSGPPGHGSKSPHALAAASTADAVETSADPPLVSPSEPAFSWNSLLSIFIGLWLLAIVFRLGYLCRSLIVLKHCIARARPLEDPLLLQVAHEVTAAFGISRIPGLLVSETVTDPLLCGLFRRVILFSQRDIANLSPAEFRLVFAHECAHLRRGDLWLSLIPALTQTLFCLFPPAWLVCSEFEATREAACDTAALQTLNAAPGAYGELLLKLSIRPERLDPLSLAGALGVSSHFRLLKRRITMLQNCSANSRRRVVAGLCLVVTGGLLGLIPWQIVAAQTANGKAQNANAAVQTATAPSPTQDQSGESEYNSGSGKDWTNAPRHPSNLDFSSGLEGWHKLEALDERPVDQSTPEYHIEVKPNGPRNGVSAVSLASVSNAPTRQALFSQEFRSDIYRGKRIRFSALLKTDQVKKEAGIWIRQDTRKWQRAWNGLDDPLKGTSDWKRYEYVFDVASFSQGLDFGIMLEGAGRVEAADFKFEVVDAKTPVTTPDFDSSLPEQPSNLDFKAGMQGWSESTHDGDDAYFAGGLDPNTKHSGVPTPYLACNSDKRGVYGVLTQWLDATPYRGKRVRLSGFIKTAGVRDYGGLMLCLNGTDNYEAYDMSKHPLKGDHDWTQVAYVADVPSDRISFTLGINLQGRGTVWMDNLKFEIVGQDVPLTPNFHKSQSEAGSSSMSRQPQNLAFTQGLTHWSHTANGDDTSPNPYYEVGVDRTVRHNDSPAAFLKSSVPNPEGYGVLRQDISAVAFRGKRIRFSGYLKTQGIEDYAGIMLCIGNAQVNKIWSLKEHPIKGTTDWTRYEFVEDVPQDASYFMLGASIKGRGIIDATDFKLEIVGNDVPLSKEEPEPISGQ